jgi:hypothetical protein
MNNNLNNNFDDEDDNLNNYMQKNQEPRIEMLYERDFVQISNNPKYDLLTIKLINDISKEDYKECWEVLLEEVIKKQNKNIIIDQRSMGKASIESRAWFVIKWLPRLKKEVSSDLQVAILPSRSIAAKLGIQYLMSAAKSVSNMNIKVLNSDDEALVWFGF